MSSFPLIDALLRRSQYGVQKINARGSAIGQALQPFAGNVQSYYGPIQQQEQALGGALNQQQASTGQQLGSQIGSSLQANQAPAAAVQQFGGGTATTGAQAGQAIGGLSSADLERLQSTATAEQVYAAALPRLAALAADQDRRAFLADAAQELGDLAAQESEKAYGRAQDERDWQRQVKQDRIERSRYRTSQRRQRREDKAASIAQRRRDQDAHKALLYEMGQDTQDNAQAWARVNQGQERVGLTGQSQAETARHHRETEAAARAREARQRAKDAKTGKTGGASYKDIVASAKDMGEPGESAAGRPIPHKVPPAEARRRLKAEFPGATPKQIAQALRAAGY